MKDNITIAHELAALLGRIVRDSTDADDRDNALDALRETMDASASTVQAPDKSGASTVQLRRRSGVEIRRRG